MTKTTNSELSNATKKIAVFISFSGQGGVERMIVNLTAEFVEQGYQVDLVLAKAKGQHFEAVAPGVRIVKLGSKHTFTSLLPLVKYLKRERPQALLVAKDRAIKVAVVARKLSGHSCRVVGRLGTTASAALEHSNWFKRWSWYAGMSHFYPQLDQLVTVSQGVADDVLQITDMDPAQITVIRNPVVTPDIYQRAKQPVEHPWFEDDGDPIVMGAGRYTRQKDFPTLLKAIAQVRQSLPCRLMILGDGKAEQKQQLLDLAESLGISDAISFPGFVKNPYAYMCRAKLFALSSLWEGSPNVLTEAMALGVPVVATDCPSGPREILQQGRYGPLVTMGDVNGLALAIEQTLKNPLPGETIGEAVLEYTQKNSASAYLRALGLSG